MKRYSKTWAELDRFEPDSPPSLRYNGIVPFGARDLLELRDPNSGQGGGPDDKPRHQYLVADGVLWTRRLPPASVGDEWRDLPGPWEAWTPGLVPSPLIEAWMADHGVARGLPPQQVWRGDCDLHGHGGQEYEHYSMPPSPIAHDEWARITEVPCPVEHCDQTLVWYEAGYVPGYRVCMARDPSGGYRLDTLCHRFHLSRDGWVLVRDECCEEPNGR
jgi:hypothetical protein